MDMGDMLRQMMMALKLQKDTEYEDKSSSSEEEEENPEEFDFDDDYKLFKLNVQEDSKSPWSQKCFKRVKKDDLDCDEEDDDLNCDDEGQHYDQDMNLSVTGPLWAQLAIMEKNGVDVLESSFSICCSIDFPDVLEMASKCQQILQAWQDRFDKEEANFEDGSSVRLKSLHADEIGDYKMWLNYYQVEEGARALMRRLSVGRVMLELGSQAELISLSKELEAAKSILRSASAAQPASGLSLEELASSKSCNQDRPARLVQLKYLVRVKACLANLYSWFRVTMFTANEKHLVINEKEGKLEVVITRELYIRRMALVSSLRLLRTVLSDKVEEDSLGPGTDYLLVSDSFVRLPECFDFVSYTSQGYALPCHILEGEDGSYSFVQQPCSGYNVLEVNKEDGTLEELEIDWELPDGRKIMKIDVVTGMGDYLLLIGKDQELHLSESEDDEEISESEDDDDEGFFAIYSISKNMIIFKLDEECLTRGSNLCLGKEDAWVTVVEYAERMKPITKFSTTGLEVLCENCEVLTTSPYWVVLEDVVQSQIIIFSTQAMQVVCREKTVIKETDLISIKQSSTVTDLEMAIISTTSPSLVQIFKLNIVKGVLEKQLQFPVIEYKDYLKVKEVLGSMEINLNSYNKHIVVPSPSAVSSILPLKWTVYEVSGEGKKFVEMDAVSEAKMIDDKIVTSFNMSEFIVYFSFGLSIEEQVGHDLDMAKKVIRIKDCSDN